MSARTLLTDVSFWHRQESVSPQLDSPHMESEPRRPSHPHFELFITSPAGKPLYHFVYDRTNPHHPHYDKSATPRPPASVASLAATLTAFQEVTYNRVSTINTNSITCLTHAYNALHAVLVSRQQPAPTLFLQALLRLALTTVNFVLSASLGDYLSRFPNARPSFTPVERILNAALLDAVSHPLPYSLLKTVALSASTSPSTRDQLGQLIASLVNNHKDVSHALMFTTGPPFPPRLVTSCSPTNSTLSPLDQLLLSLNLSPEDDDKRTIKVFPQTFAFQKGVYVSSKTMHLRLHPDFYDTFKRAVGGQLWRPEWTHQPPHTVRLVALASTENGALQFLNDVEQALDRASSVTNLLISMERPLSVKPFEVYGVRDIIVIKDEKRLAGSLGSFCYTAALSTLLSLQKVHTIGSMSETARSNMLQSKYRRACLRKFAKWGLRVIMWDSRFVILFDDAKAPDDNEIIRICRDIFVPQLESYINFILPEGDHIVIHSQTPMAGFLAPFIS